MRILFIAMTESIHTARWISQLKACNWDIHIYSSTGEIDIHEEITNVTFHRCLLPKVVIRSARKKVSYIFKIFDFITRRLLKNRIQEFRTRELSRVINRIQPDIIHSLEFQSAGYLTMKAKENYKKGKFPTWIATNWGSDIYLFGRLIEHESQIKRLLNNCDYYSCECLRDVELAKLYGFTGIVLPVFPNTGGFDFTMVDALRKSGPTSSRRLIMLKGYQGWSGRALVGLRALERCADLLQEYQIGIYSANYDVQIAAELLTKATGVRTFLIPNKTKHQEMLRLHGQARISIGLNISDGISTSLLEAMVMGSFPIQSFTAATDGWIVDGDNGIVVHPEEPTDVEQALRRALTDDQLVDQAATINYQVVREKLDSESLRNKSIDMYSQVLKDSTKH